MCYISSVTTLSNSSVRKLCAVQYSLGYLSIISYLVSCRGAGRNILLPLDRARLVVSQVASLYAVLNELADGSSFIFRVQTRGWSLSSHITFSKNENKSISQHV